jgi:hypothetical protein
MFDCAYQLWLLLKRISAIKTIRGQIVQFHILSIALVKKSLKVSKDIFCGQGCRPQKADFKVEYLGEFESTFEETVLRGSGVQKVFFDTKKNGTEISMHGPFDSYSF